MDRGSDESEERLYKGEERGEGMRAKRECKLIKTHTVNIRKILELNLEGEGKGINIENIEIQRS